jgi:pterin-4a-carbinolamine dehydratase
MTERPSRPRIRAFAGNLRTERGKHVLLATQKVEGSNPFSRSQKSTAFTLVSDRVDNVQHHPLWGVLYGRLWVK